MEPKSYDSVLHEPRSAPTMSQRVRRAAASAAAFVRRVIARISPGTGLLAPVLARLPRLPQRPARVQPEPQPGPPSRVHASECTELLAVPAMRVPTRARPRVALVIGSLSAGGAERQLAAFAVSPRTRALVEPIIVLSFEPEGAAGHYAPMVRDAGIPLIHAAPGIIQPSWPALPVSFSSDTLAVASTAKVLARGITSP